MSLRLRRIVLASTLAALPLVVASTASAQENTNPCGNIEFTAIGECHFEFSGGCKAKCEPLNLVASCDGECNVEISASCTADCSGGCTADCEVDPGSFECSGSCSAGCSATATAACEANEDKASCEATAEASCQADCDVQCEATPPSADCSAKCEASCNGSCEASANADCNVSCSAELQGGCEASCDAPEGAIFCDGQFINVSSIPACIDYLLTEYEYKLEFEVSVESSCNASPALPSKAGVGLFGLVAIAGLAAARRRRRQA